MEFTGVGGGLMLALAAGLWLIYLVPSWLRRREYLATELNAVRLQQTLRVLAETAEVPAEVHAETSARSVAQQQKTLHDRQRIEDAAAHARAAAVARAERGARVQAAASATATADTHARVRAASRLRRTRAVTSLVLLAAVATLIIQVTLMVTTGVAPAAPAVLAFAGVVSITSVGLLGRLATVSRARSSVRASSAPVARRVAMSQALQQEVAAEVVEKAWTPVAVPKPLYLSRAVVDTGLTGTGATDHAATLASLRAAAAASDTALRAAQASPEVTPIERQVAAPVAAPSRFAAMGVVEDAQTVGPDIDAVMRRRRAAG